MNYGRRKTDRVPRHLLDLNRHLFWLVVLRGVILFLGLNLAYSLGLMPSLPGEFPFLALFNIFTVVMTLGYLALWWRGQGLILQLYFQIGVDLCITTVLVAQTGGVESAFVSFYILIIIYSGVTLGRNGGMVGASLSTLLYAGIIACRQLGILDAGSPPAELKDLAFRVALHAIGFFAVAFLGIHLSLRLHAVEEQLEEKIDSLNQLQRLHEHIVSSIRSGLITTDLDGRIAVYNDTAEELTERESREILGKPVRIVIGDGLWDEITCTDFFQDARPLRHEGWITLPSNRRRYLGFSISPLLDPTNQLLGYVVSFQDLTDLKRLEEDVRVKDRMAAIGRMAAGIAHEIRNPLTSMRGSVEIIRSHLQLPPGDEHLLDIIMRESDRLNTFVEDFLNFARPGRYTRESIGLVTLLRDSVTLLQNNSEVREKYQVRLEADAGEITIFGSADQLRQVFWNLAQNALRAMPAGGSLTIQAHRADGGGATVVFRDDGIGMSEEEQDRLFQPFQSGFQKGAGLGLSIIFQIMEDHGGKITFDSKQGRGTTVTLHFPFPHSAIASTGPQQPVVKV